MEKVIVLGGEYTVILDSGTMSFERNGEPWAAANAEFAHVDLIYALATELAVTRRAVERLEDLPMVAISQANPVIKTGLLKMFDEEIERRKGLYQPGRPQHVEQVEFCRLTVESFMNALITGEAK